MAARADILLDRGENDPKNWDQPFGSGQIHIAISVFSDSEEKWRRTMALARQQYHGFSGVSVVDVQDFGAQPGDLNPLGFKDGIGQPAIEGSGVDPLPGQGRPIKAGEFILGYPGEAGVPVATLRRMCSGATAPSLAYASTNRGSERSTDSCETMLKPTKNANCWPRNWSVVGAAARHLTLAPVKDDPALGQDPQRNNDFNYADDPDGKQVPLGCHMRRMNPRDTKMPVLTDVNIHRIIRRSTTYGAPYDPNALSERDDEVPHGIYFLFISAKAMATMEFLQREWINSGNFTGIGEERDPIVGLQEEDATFTIPKDPVRRRIHGIQSFNVLRGGEYMFMPSLSALKWLGDLKA